MDTTKKFRLFLLMQVQAELLFYTFRLSGASKTLRSCILKYYFLNEKAVGKESENLQKLSAKQNISITLHSVNIVIKVWYVFIIRHYKYATFIVILQIIK